MPHAQPPAPSQRSARTASQAVQAPASTPQLATEAGWHWPAPSQQPFGQLAELHAHVPASLHCWPMAHWAPLPHLQPLALHESARAGSHATQAPPLPPHIEKPVEVVQVAPAQQPLGQLQPSHAPPSQCWPPPHVPVMQVPPQPSVAPHALPLHDGVHVPVPHRLGPAPPQFRPAGHVPHSMILPQRPTMLPQ